MDEHTRGEREPDEWEQLADELAGGDGGSGGAREDRNGGPDPADAAAGHGDESGAAPRRAWLLWGAAAVAAGLIAGLLVWSPWGKDADSAAPGAGAPVAESQQDPLGLMASPWPENALTALKDEHSVVVLTRLLLTGTQIQATGAAEPVEAAASEDDESWAWQDFVYVDDTAIVLGDPLLEVDEAAMFDIDDVAGAAIGRAVTEAAAGGEGNTEITQAIVERDTVDEDHPVVIEVYWRDDAGMHVTRTVIAQ